MGVLRSLTGTLSVAITSADPSHTLAGLNEMGIQLHRAKHSDPLTVTAELSQKDYPAAAGWIEKQGGQIQIRKKNGVYWSLISLLRRPVFLLGLAVILALTVTLPRMVLFVYVEGNEKLPERMILEKAGECGIRFGAARQAVRSEKMKNALLGKLPQLEWAGINTVGCVAVITVQERSRQEPISELPAVSSIVASRDGIVLDVTVTRGNRVCQVGQAVKAGQTLISGYTDCGIKIKAEAAQGEIYAKTMHTLSVSALGQTRKKTRLQSCRTAYTLVAGRRMVPLYGKEAEGAAVTKTVKQVPLTLFGGFTLPVSLLVEEYACYESETADREDSEAVLTEFARDYLLAHMISGKIIGSESCMEESECGTNMTFTYFCIEMIGVNRVETDLLQAK